MSSCSKHGWTDETITESGMRTCKYCGTPEKNSFQTRFNVWEEQCRKDLEIGYHQYLKETVLDDENFDIKTTEDYWTWAEEEFREMGE